MGGTLKFESKLDDILIHDAMNNLEQGKIGKMIPIYAPIPSNYDFFPGSRRLPTD